MNIFQVLFMSGALLLTGCASDPQLVAQKLVVVMPDEALFTSCEQPPSGPITTELQAARRVRILYNNNVRCKNSLDSVHQFLIDAKRETETPSK